MSHKLAYCDLIGLYSAIQQWTWALLDCCGLAVGFTLKEAGRRPETMKFVTNLRRRHGLCGATPVKSKQAIRLPADSLSVQSHRKSTGVIIWSLICPPVSNLMKLSKPSLSLSLPLSVLLLSTSAALSFALISLLMTIDSASVKRWISLNPPEFLVEVMWVFHAVSRDEFMCVKDVRDVKEDGKDETNQTLIAVMFSPR